MGISSLRLVLEPDLGVYFPGQDVVGTLRADVDSPVVCKAIEVSCKGKSFVRFTVEKDNDETHICTQKEHIFKLTINVLNTTENTQQQLSCGCFSWPFTFRIPQDIPSSFDGIYGYIRYQIKANAIIPLELDSKAHLYFSVNAPLDLNISRQALQPLNVEKTDTSCCWCCFKGPVALLFNCKRSGAVIGEDFKIRGEVINQGSGEVKHTKVELFQEVKYYAEGEIKVKNRSVFHIKRFAISPGDSFIYDDVPFRIKAVTPNIENCSSINVSYKLQFRAHMGCFTSVNEEVPFVIGTIPFRVEGAAMPPISSPSQFASYPQGAATSETPFLPISKQPISNPLAPLYTPPVNMDTSLPPPYTPYPETSSQLPSDQPSAPLPPIGFIPITTTEMPPAMGPLGVPPIAGSHCGIITTISVPNSLQPLIGQELPLDNPYPIQCAPHYETCWMSRDEDVHKRRLEPKAAPPNYISYSAAMMH